MRTAALVLTVGMAFPMAALAKSSTSENEDVGNPQRVICRTEQQIGSRLSKIKRCHTAAEWAEVKRENRRVIDKVQAHKPYQDVD